MKISPLQLKDYRFSEIVLQAHKEGQAVAPEHISTEITGGESPDDSHALVAQLTVSWERTEDANLVYSGRLRQARQAYPWQPVDNWIRRGGPSHQGHALAPSCGREIVVSGEMAYGSTMARAVRMKKALHSSQSNGTSICGMGSDSASSK
jgi:hypothetical protein